MAALACRRRRRPRRAEAAAATVVALAVAVAAAARSAALGGEPLGAGSVLVSPPARSGPAPAVRAPPAAPRPEFCAHASSARERVLRRPTTAMALVELPPQRPWAGGGGDGGGDGDGGGGGAGGGAGTNSTRASAARPPLKLYRNMYYHNEKWYALVDAADVEGAAAAGFAPPPEDHRPPPPLPPPPREGDEKDEDEALDEDDNARPPASAILSRLGLLSRNQAALAGVDPSPTHTFSLTPVAAADARAFVENLPGDAGTGGRGGLCVVPGLSLFLDHPFPAFPDNLGHWGEALMPLYSALRDAVETGRGDEEGGGALAAAEDELRAGGGGAERGEDGGRAAAAAAAATGVRGGGGGDPLVLERVVLTNLKRGLLLDWPKNMLALALSPLAPNAPAPLLAAADDPSPPSPPPPPSLLAAEERRADAAAAAPLPPVLDAAGDFDAWARRGWLVFERALVLQDRYEPRGGRRDRAVAQLVREWRREGGGGGRGEGRDGTSGGAAAGAQAAAAAAAAVASAVAERSGAAALAAAEAGAVGYSRPEHAEALRAAAHRRVMYPWPPQPVPAGAVIARRGGVGGSVGGGGGSGSGSDRGSGGGGASPPSAPPALPRRPPKVVTVLLYPPGHPPITNHLDLVDLLENVTEPLGMRVRTVSVTPEAPLASHLAAASTTGLLVGRHGPLLASAAPFLPPGAAVLELLPYKWDWRDMSRLYVNMTKSARGSGRPLHHWAWRAGDARWCRYAGGAREALRYGGWTAGECTARDCLMAHARAGLEVDLRAVRAILEARLPRWLAAAEEGETEERAAAAAGGGGGGGGGDRAWALVEELAMEAWPPVE